MTKANYRVVYVMRRRRSGGVETWTRAESAEREREEMRVALQFYAEGKCRCGVEYQAGERARAALKGGK